MMRKLMLRMSITSNIYTILTNHYYTYKIKQTKQYTEHILLVKKHKYFLSFIFLSTSDLLC